MDRRFFENDNLEDLSKDESPKSFQKIDEEDEVLKENYMWSYEEDDFSSETDLNASDEYAESYEDDNLDDYTQVNEDYNELEESEGTDKNISLEENTVMEFNCQCDEEYSDSEYYETSEGNFNRNYRYCDSDDNTSSDQRCDCDYEYCDSEEEYECNCSESEYCSSSDKSSSCNDNYSSTFDEDKRYRENKEYYLKGKKEGYNAGYEAGARDAIRAAYRAGYKRGLRAAGYRI